jgi:G6PDH family F420-dependent oxidoreductase
MSSELGFALSSEEHRPNELIRQARKAEETGFAFALISDHFHPWVDTQGQSPFVWSVIGGIAQATGRLRLGTGVTCPTVRVHPAIVAHAAATAADMMPGRFFLGVGSGENLNEHVHGGRWPAADERLEMLEEAVGVIRLLWEGGERTRRGRHYTVEGARIYTLPEQLPPIYVAASGQTAAEVAARVGDGLISTAPSEDIVGQFRGAGGHGPTYGMMHVCWAPEEAHARRTARAQWPNAAIGGELGQELPLPRHFEQAAETVREEDVAERVVCGPDPERHLEKIRTYERAGFDHVYVHQIGPDQDGFFDFYRREVMPKL